MSTKSKELAQNYGLIRQTTSVAFLEPINLPAIPDDYILVETAAVALNPTDWTTLAAPGATHTLVGNDYAGTVVAVGPAVTKNFDIGDRVCGIAHGANDLKPLSGAFARYIMAKGDLQVKVPDVVPWEKACTIGVGGYTAGIALWKVLSLEKPPSEQLAQNGNHGESWVLVYGGSTATGTIAIQLAKLSGYRVITTASPKHHKLLRARGADLVLDYRSENVGQAIQRLTNDSLRFVLDCVATDATAAICATAFGHSGGKYCSLLPVACDRADVVSEFFLGYAVTGEDYVFESVYIKGQPEFYNIGRTICNIVEDLWSQGLLETHPEQIESGGLLGIPSGMQKMQEGKVSGVKLVYLVGETPFPTSL